MEMKIIKIAAKKRRAKYLAEQGRTGWTATKLAIKYKMTPQRMSQLLRMAVVEAEGKQ